MKLHYNRTAGAHGEWTALMIFKAYHLDNGEGHRDEVIVPDSLMVQTLHLRRVCRF